MSATVTVKVQELLQIAITNFNNCKLLTQANAQLGLEKIGLQQEVLQLQQDKANLSESLAAALSNDVADANTIATAQAAAQQARMDLQTTQAVAQQAQLDLATAQAAAQQAQLDLQTKEEEMIALEQQLNEAITLLNNSNGSTVPTT